MSLYYAVVQLVKLSTLLFVICLQLEYFETVLNTYFSTEAQQALKSLQESLLEKACESGSEDAASDDKQVPSVSPDDLLVSIPNIHACP